MQALSAHERGPIALIDATQSMPQATCDVKNKKRTTIARGFWAASWRPSIGRIVVPWRTATIQRHWRGPDHYEWGVAETGRAHHSTS